MRLFVLFLVLLFLSVEIASAQTAQTSSTASSSGPSDGFVPIINQVGQQGLNLLRTVLFVYLLIYAVFLGLAVAFGQAGSAEISSFILGTALATGAQLIASIYLAILG